MTRLTTYLALLIFIFNTKVLAQDQYTEAEFLRQIVKEASENEASSKLIENKGLLSVVPTGSIDKLIDPKCDPKEFETSVLKIKQSKEYFAALNSYFQKCGNTLAKKGSTGLGSLLNYAQIEYPFFQHPLVKKFSIKLDSGVTVPAILAMKNDSKPRPLVIFRCGSFGSAGESSSPINFLIQLYDQTPFNVLIIASKTGMDYMKTNHFFSIGGWEEGFESVQVANWMKDKWEFKDRISSIHHVGISLGGNDAVMSSYYNDTNLRPDGRKVFNSVTAVCPVIQLKPTLDKVYSSLAVGTVFAISTRQQLKNAAPYLHDVPELAMEGQNVSRKEMVDLIGKMATTSLEKRGTSLTVDQFFQRQNFLNMPEVKTPMLVWASKDDIVVNNQMNAGMLAADPRYSKSDTTGFLNLDYGNHCAFSAAYSFPVASAVFRTFILNNSPEFLDSYQKTALPWKYGFSKLSRGQKHVGQSWKFSKRSDKVKVTFKIFEKSASEDCESADPFSAPAECMSEKSYSIPVQDLKLLGARKPANNVEAQSLTREFNTKIQFQTSSGVLNGTQASQFFLSWYSGY